MAKGKKGVMAKQMKLIAKARKETNKHLIMLLGALAIGIVFWCLVSFTPLNDHTMTSSAVIFIVAIAVVVFIGEVGVKMSRFNTEYTKLRNEYGVSKQEVRDYAKSHKGQF